MRKQFLLAATFCAALTFVSCESTDKPEEQTEPEVLTVLKGSISEDLTLEKNGSYKLEGAFHVEEGATLTIEEGVEIVAVDDEVADYILIEHGAKINAVGTATNPIIMTSELKEHGAWGGIHICGNASTNAGAGKSEIGNAPYGGSNDADNSGVLKYIRLEYTGFAFDEEHESNGVSFYGVGNGTEVSYIQAYRGSDDGFEFFGGTVNVKNMIATSCSDDSFDWTDGWRGKAQFLVAYHESEKDLGYTCDCLMECDNNGDNNSATPASRPVISNVTLVGNNSATKKDGVMLKAGTQIELSNAIITGKVYPIYTKTAVTEDALVNGASKLVNIAMTGDLFAKEGKYSSDAFIANKNNSNDYANKLTNKFVGIVDGGVAPTGDFFTAVTYTGAVDPANDWTTGWVLTGDAPEEILLEGEIASGTVTITKNANCKLSGAVVVKSGATLVIEEGAKIVAVDDEVADYILIEQGGKIDAQGSATNPIVMTSELEKAGAWGGIHTCGYASTNAGETGKSEIGKSPYGGDNDADNSGILKYIRLEYTGFKLNEEQESNGISFYGVGNGTSVSYIQAYRGADDGFEFFGGSVDVKYMIATSSKDDSFDWTEGWRGRGQYLIANQEDESVISYPCDCLIEADNNGDNAAASPMSHPVLSNLTLVGNNGSEDTDGVMLKASTEVEIHNAIITGKQYPIVTKTAHTEEALEDGSSILNYITMGGELKSNESIYSNALFSAATGNSTDYTNGLTDVVYGVVEGGVAPSDDFFDATDYKGAISKDNDWAAGWAIL